MAIIENARIFTPGGVFRTGSVEYSDKINSVSLVDGLDAKNYLIPGLVEIHSHGALGRDHSDGSPAGLKAMADYYAKEGITSFLATTMTYNEDELKAAMDNVRGHVRGGGAKCVGVNMEGPFLSREKKGAHMDGKLHVPDADMFLRLNEASGGAVKLISVAPEIDGAIDFILEASRVCHVSLGHSAADYDTAIKAFEAGADHVTHLFNAMNPFLHRAPGITGAALDMGAHVELICDGMHLHPSMVRAMMKLFGDKACMISDSIRPAGLPDGEYTSGGLPVIMKDGKALLTDGTIAGASVSLMTGLVRSVGFGVPIEAAVLAATRNNAASIGMDGELGAIAPGRAADMVLMDSGLNIIKVIINGEEVY